MFDSLYPDAADTALATKAARPPEPQPTPWFKGFWSAAGTAPLRAGAESARAWTSLMTPEAAGALDAPSLFGAPGSKAKPQLDDELRAQQKAIASAVKEMSPDPQSTGAASMIVHDVGRFVTKAAGYAALGGAPAAVVGVGLDEGINEAQRRMDEGVDAATAAKLGVTKGIASGIAVALPVAGRTLAQTVGLAAAGGPGSFIAEQVTAREILQAADYTKEAEQIDPLDPMGLGVSFFGSLIFGAGSHAARGVRARADATAADARAMASETPPSRPTEVAQAVQRAVSPEQVDAAHVTVLQAQRETTALHRADDFEASAGHARALDTAAEQIAVGQRVSVADVAPVDGARVAELAVPTIQRAVQILNEVTAAHSGQTDASLTAMLDGRPAGFLDYTVFEGRPQISMVEVAEEFRRQGIGAELVRELQRKFPDAEIDWGVMTEAGVALRESLPKVVQEVASVRAKAAELETALAERGALERQAEAFNEAPPTDETRAQQREFIEKNGERWNELHDKIDALEQELADAQPTRTLIDTTAPAKATAGAATVKASTPEAAPAQPEGGAPAGEPSAPVADYLTREIARIEQMDPDMPVMLEGMDAPRPMREVLAEITALAKQEADDAPLVKVAAECALRG